MLTYVFQNGRDIRSDALCFLNLQNVRVINGTDWSLILRCSILYAVPVYQNVGIGRLEYLFASLRLGLKQRGCPRSTPIDLGQTLIF